MTTNNTTETTTTTEETIWSPIPKRSATGSKTHLGWAGSVQAACGARAASRAPKNAEITCEKCIASISNRRGN